MPRTRTLRQLARPLAHLCSILLMATLVSGLLLPASTQAAPRPETQFGSQVSWLDRPLPPSDAFARATQPGQVQFPRDYGPHGDFQTEWWYYTGNLETGEGRPFGYQLTFFRSAVLPPKPKPGVSPGLEAQPGDGSPAPSPALGESAWRGRQLYSAHFTLSDIGGDRFYPYERYSRGSLGLAGAQAEPYQVWLDDWSATALGEGRVQLRAQADDIALDLTLSQSLAPVLQGDRGLSQKGSEPGNASYYYSLVQQPTVGSVTLGDRAYPVSGVSWKDHEYSTSALSPGTVGWDWFSLQFDNGAALMLYNLRHEDGSAEPTSSGTFVAADGSTQHLTSGDWQLEVLQHWRSPHSGNRYPARWHLRLPKLDLDLEGQPLMADQELRTATATYWEGALALAGRLGGEPITARGYGELTGYGDRLDSLLADKS